ncbi:MAG: hypothetical protein EB010_06515, partial [Acidimicrobiia bacterium]|nr:hypothetical protein [Acidimicrobiia bacterium]
MLCSLSALARWWSRSTAPAATSGMVWPSTICCAADADVLAGIYSKRTGKPVAQIRAAMTAETWFTAQEAVAFGLADSMTEMLAMAACWHPRAVTKTAPPTVRRNLERGIRQYEDGLGGDGLEEATVIDARNLAKGEEPSAEKVKKAVAWWARNERFLEAEADTPADVAANLWGGAAGRDWFKALAAQIDEEEELSEPEDKISTISTPAAVDGATTAPTSQQTPHKMTDSNTVVAAAPSAPTATLDASSIESIVAKAVAAAISAKVPTAAPAPEPIAPARIENLGNPLLEAHKKMQA